MDSAQFSFASIVNLASIPAGDRDETIKDTIVQRMQEACDAYLIECLSKYNQFDLKPIAFMGTIESNRECLERLKKSDRLQVYIAHAKRHLYSFITQTESRWPVFCRQK